MAIVSWACGFQKISRAGRRCGPYSILSLSDGSFDSKSQPRRLLAPTTSQPHHHPVLRTMTGALRIYLLILMSEGLAEVCHN